MAQVADAPDAFLGTRHYQFLPGRSVLNESGGIAGFNTNMPVRGTFDFSLGAGVTDVWPPRIEAHFSNVKAGGIHPILATVYPLDRVLILSEMTGYQVPLISGLPIDVYQFQGKKFDGSSVNVYAALSGSWLYLRGGTKPPPGSADYFSYEIKALARLRPTADFDQNESVDAVDLAKWASRFGLSSAAGASSTMGDADGDLDIDGQDFLAWQRQAGETPPSLDQLDAMLSVALAASAPGGVPEPTAGLLLAIGAALMAAWRR